MTARQNALKPPREPAFAVEHIRADFPILDLRPGETDLLKSTMQPPARCRGR